MSNRIKVEEGSENIFKDLGFSDEVAEKELLKAQLGAEISRILKERKLTQGEAAKLLGVKHLDISRLKAAKLSDYSIDRLMTFLNRLNHDIGIHTMKKQTQTPESDEFRDYIRHRQLEMLSEDLWDEYLWGELGAAVRDLENEPWGKPSEETNPDAS